jgi:hypothetical protein
MQRFAINLFGKIKASWEMVVIQLLGYLKESSLGYEKLTRLNRELVSKL